jgi:hypothetical protein
MALVRRSSPTLDGNEFASSPRYLRNHRAVSCWGRWSEHLHAKLARPLPRVCWSFSAARQSVRRSAGRASHSCQDLAPEYVLGFRQRFARSGLVARIISHALVSAWVGRGSLLRPCAFWLSGALSSAFPCRPGGWVKLLSNWSIDADAQMRPCAARTVSCAPVIFNVMPRAIELAPLPTGREDPSRVPGKPLFQ